MATRWRAKHQKAKRQLQYAARYGFYASPVGVHYFEEYSRYGQGEDDDNWPDYDEFDDDGGDCQTCGGDGWMSAQEAECDWINYGPDEIARCPNCKGSGLAKDQSFW